MVLWFAAVLIFVCFRVLVHFFEEIRVRQGIAELAVIAIHAGILDDDRAQENYQFGFGSGVIAVLEQAARYRDIGYSGYRVGELSIRSSIRPPSTAIWLFSIFSTDSISRVEV